MKEETIMQQMARLRNEYEASWAKIRALASEAKSKQITNGE